MDIIKGSVTSVHVMELQVRDLHVLIIFISKVTAMLASFLGCRHGEPGIFSHMPWCNQNRTGVLEQKGNFLCIVQPTMCSMFSVYDICLPIRVVSCPLPLLIFMFWTFGYAHTQLRSFYPLSTFDGSHVRKSTRLSTPAQLQCLHSRVWEPGNEATAMHPLIHTAWGWQDTICHVICAVGSFQRSNRE